MCCLLDTIESVLRSATQRSKADDSVINTDIPLVTDAVTIITANDTA